MVGKVGEFWDKATPSGVVASVVNLYSKYQEQRSGKTAEIKELRNYIFATDTTTTSNATLPWKNKTTTPKICQVRDNLHANYQAALFPNDDWFSWEGGDEESATRAKGEVIEAYMKNKLRSGGFQTIVSKLLYDYIDYGNTFADCEFVDDNYTDPETGEITQGFIGPKAIRVSYHDLVFNPSAIDFASSPKFVRYVKSIGELKEEVSSRPELQYNKDVLDYLDGSRKHYATYEQADWDKAEGYVADGFGSLQEYYGSGLVEIIEATGDFHDPNTGEFFHNQIITIIDRNFLIRQIANPRWLKGSSMVHAGWRLRPDNLYAMGPLDNLVGMQYRIDHLENLKADVFDMIAHPPLLVQGDVDDFEWGPGVEINMGEDGSVSMLNVDGTALNADMQIQNLMQIMEEMAGAPREAMGIRSPGEKTMFEVAQLQNAAGRIFQEKITHFEKEVIEPLLNNMLEKARRNMQVSDLIRVIDNDIGVVEFMNISKEDITAAGKLVPVGARHFAAQAQLMQNLNGVFSSPIGQMIAPHTSAKKLATMVEEVMGVEKFGLFQDNVGVTENAETQKVAQASQEQVDVDAETDVQGDF
jgi:hypothetical protein